MKMGKIILIAGCMIGVIVLGAAGYLLYDGIQGLREQTHSLDEAMSTRRRYYRNDPFPKPENVEIEKQSAVAIQSAFTNLLARLGEGQIQPPRLTPSTFMRLLGQKQQSLIQAAGRSQSKETVTVLPQNFAFGFAPYFAGTMRPKPEHVRELTRQLLILERLFLVFFEEGTDEIVSVLREEFETKKKQQWKRPRFPNKKKPAPSREEGNALFTKSHFTFTCRSKEAALLQVLNRLAADQMFVVVTSISVKKEIPDVLVVTEREEEAPPAVPVMGLAELLNTAGTPKDGKLPARKPKRRPEDMLRDDRVVCGHRVESPATVTLELDVYRFKGD